MTSSFKVKYGQTFDNIFIEGEGTQTFGIIDSDGVDVGQKYLPVSDGDPQDPCGFLDSTGEDIGPKLCKPGTDKPDTTWVVTIPDGTTLLLTFSGVIEGRPVSISGSVTYTYGTGSLTTKTASFSKSGITSDGWINLSSLRDTAADDFMVPYGAPLTGWFFHKYMNAFDEFNAWTIKVTCGRYEATTTHNGGVYQNWDYWQYINQKGSF